MAVLEETALTCGYTDYYAEYFNIFPPKGPLPPGPDYRRKGCDIYDDIYNAVYYVNPCFNIYHLTDFCPFLWDELGFPSLGTGPNNYFNRTGKRLSLPCI
jgi:carboxypeptidase D